MLHLHLAYRIKLFKHFLQVTCTFSPTECLCHSEWPKVLAPHLIVQAWSLQEVHELGL